MKITHAAVAIIARENGEVLLGLRPAGKPWAGYWEFPGGKVEAGELPQHALNRELAEELGIVVMRATPWLTRTFNYPKTDDSPAKTVQLHFFRVSHWQGEPYGKEGQQLSWQNPQNLNVAPMLPANTPILSALNLPPIYAITNLAELGEPLFFERLQTALQSGLRLIQIREKHLNPTELTAFATRVLAMSKPFGAKVLLNTDASLAQALGMHGVHLNAAQLMTLQEKPENLMVSASCHNAQELQKAATLGLDFVVLSPVKNTLSHADALTLGWQNFARLIESYSLPVYALGGLQSDDLALAQQHGAHGIAMQRGAWLC